MDCKLRAKNCGGCPMLATEYAAQLKKKEADVRALLGKYGPVAPIRGMETPYHYRNKVISTFAPAAGGKLTSGIYAAHTHKVLPVESCLLQDEVLDKVMLAVRAAANACRYQPFNEDKGTGLLRHCLLRRGVATGQVMVVLVTAQPVLPGAKNFVKALLAEAEKRGVPVTTVVQNYNPRRTSVVLGEDEKVLYGKGFILDTLCGKTYALSPRSFYQVEEFNVYAYVKQLIDGNDVSVLLGVADEVVKVMDTLKFYIPTLKDMSMGLKLSLELIRRYLPEGAFSRIYLDEQPVDSGSYVAGAVALESGDLNTAGVAMFKIKPKTEGVRLYWAEDLPAGMTLAEAEAHNVGALLESDGVVVDNAKVTCTYKKKGLFSSKSTEFPTQPGIYTQTATVSGNYSCEKITRTIVIS